MRKKIFGSLAGVGLFAFGASPALAVIENCAGIDGAINGGFGGLKANLQAAVADAGTGLQFNMWVTIVDRDGVVCTVEFSGGDRQEQWPGSRVISAQKANTANAFSLDGLALSTANLWTAVQPGGSMGIGPNKGQAIPGGSLFGLQFSNPVNPAVAYGPTVADAANYGAGASEPGDPMVGKFIGGVNVFGGGLALYRAGSSEVIGALGISGDTSCTDHIVAWILRDTLGVDFVPGGVSATGDDNIVNDLKFTGNIAVSPSGWGHPECSANETEVAAALPDNYPIGN